MTTGERCPVCGEADHERLQVGTVSMLVCPKIREYAGHDALFFTGDAWAAITDTAPERRREERDGGEKA